MFRRGFLSALVLAALFFALCAVAAASFSQGVGGDGAVKIRLVDEDGSAVSRLAVNIVRDMDFIGASMEIKTARRGDALAALKAGECAAVIILPEGYLGAIVSGRPCRGEIILSPAAALHSDLVESIARAGEVLLAAGQYGVFGGERVIAQNGLGDIHSDYLTQTNLRLLDEAAGAYDNYFQITVLDYADTGMSLAAHYALGWLVLLCGICTMFFGRLLLADLPLLPRMRAAGVSDGHFMCFKLLLPGLFRLVIMGAAVWLLHRLGMAAPVTAAGLLCALLAAAVITLFETGLSFALGSGAGAVSTLLGFGGLFLTGGILPRAMLPKALLVLGDVTPFGAARGVLAPLVGGGFAPLCWLCALVYAGLGLWLIRRRLQAALRGGDAR